MKRGTGFWLIFAALLVLIGCIVLGGAMSMLNWDFSNLSTKKYETNNYEINEDFTHISVTSDTADITFVKSENSECFVECFEDENARHTVTVSDGSLIIGVVKAKQWYKHIGIGFKTPKITVHLPQSEYGNLSVKSDTGDVKIPGEFKFANIDISENTGKVTCSASSLGEIKIKTTTGSITLEKLSADSLGLSVSTGMISVSDISCKGDIVANVTTGRASLSGISCKNITSNGTTGNINLTAVIAEGNITVERSTGNVHFDKSDASEIFAETTTGSIKGSLLTEKVFVTKTDTGSVSVPSTSSGGKCELITDTGNIKITLE